MCIRVGCGTFWFIYGSARKCKWLKEKQTKISYWLVKVCGAVNVVCVCLLKLYADCKLLPTNEDNLNFVYQTKNASKQAAIFDEYWFMLCYVKKSII